VGDHRPGGIEHDGVAHRSGCTGQYRAGLRGVGVSIPADEIGDSRAGKSEVRRVEGQLVDGSRPHPPDGAGGRGGQFVEPVVTVHHQHAGLPSREYSRHHLGQVAERATDQPGPRPGRVRQRPKEVENRRYADLPARRPRITVGRVEYRGETEADSHFCHTTGHVVGAEIDPNSEGLEHIRAATAR